MPRVNEAEEFKKLLTGFQRLASFYFAQAKNKKQRREIIDSLRESRNKFSRETIKVIKLPTATTAGIRVNPDGCFPGWHFCPGIGCIPDDEPCPPV